MQREKKRYLLHTILLILDYRTFNRDLYLRSHKTHKVGKMNPKQSSSSTHPGDFESEGAAINNPSIVKYADLPNRSKIIPKGEKFQDNFRIYFWMLFVLGTINNTGYVLVNSSAQSLATKFHKENFMAVFQL